MKLEVMELLGLKWVGNMSKQFKEGLGLNFTHKLKEIEFTIYENKEPISAKGNEGKCGSLG